MQTLHIERADPSHADFLFLARQLTAFLAELNGEKNDFFVQFNQASSLTHAVVAYDGDKPIGCGGLRRNEDGSAEIKRMFVLPSLRGAGIGVRILNELESIAQEQSYSPVYLETSKRLGAAIHLYQKSGYDIIPNYGPYVGLEDSICMRKLIVDFRIINTPDANRVR